jgi:hypothetical protein
MMARVIAARDDAAKGVDYSPRAGALCPLCGERSKIYSTMPWEDNTRIRYHRCENGSCLMASLKVSIKSIEVDSVRV